MGPRTPVPRATAIQTHELDYELPPERIAQHPEKPRDAARLLVVCRNRDTFENTVFRDLPAFLRAGDCLVINQTRVVPARFVLVRATGGRIGGLFVREIAAGRWEVLLAGGGRLRVGERLQFDVGGAAAILRARGTEGRCEIEIEPAVPAAALLGRIGRAPLPPYIRRSGERARAEDTRDRMDYQTVFARVPGALAAPTAGLHFTDKLLARLEGAGVQVARLILHVGLGTFQPVDSDDLAGHVMHGEPYELGAEAAERINATRRAGGRTVAVGTTSVRVLETVADASGAVRATQGTTRLLIYPPYRFRAVDALITNFHLPRSTLLALVYAFAGAELTRRAYREAIGRGYRFYSFGDAMLVL